MAEHDRRLITFSQAEGASDLPSQLKLNEVSREARAFIWAQLYQYLAIPRADAGTGWENWVTDDWHGCLRTWHVKVLFRPIDDFDPTLSSCLAQVKAIIFTEDLMSLFDFLTHLMRHPYTAYTERLIADAFEESRMAYKITEKTIYPIASSEEGETIARAISDLAEPEHHGPRSHLLLAGSLLSAGDWAGSVRESIHAVEGAAKVLDPKSNTLSEALKRLDGTGKMNPNLRRGLEALYNYSSDEEGIRHAKVFESQPNVDQADALYMFGACAAFVSFLLARAT